MKPAAWAEQRADAALVDAQQKNKKPGEHDGLEYRVFSRSGDCRS